MTNRYRRPILVASVLLVLGMAAFCFQTAVAQDATAVPIILTDDRGKHPLGLHLEILEDPSRILTIEEVSSPPYASRFVPSHSEVPNFGFTKSAIWVKLKVDNQSIRTNNWLLELSFPNIFYVDLYTPRPDGKGFTVKQSGVLRPASSRDFVHPHILFNLLIPSKSQETVYMRFENGGSLSLPLTLWEKDAFLNYTLPRQWLIALLYGGLLSLLFYNIFLLFSLREASYLYLILFLTAYLLWNASYDTYTEIYLFPAIYNFRLYYFPLFFCSFIAATLLFSDSILDLKSQLPLFHRIVTFFLIVLAVLLLLVPFVDYSILARLMVILALPSVLSVVVAGLILWKQEYAPTRFFMIAVFGFLISVALNVLVRLGILPSSFLTENLYRVGVVWLAVFWSITLANRINLLKAETESANRNLQSSEHRLSQILDGMPLGVVLYTKDHKPKYANRSSIELLSYPSEGLLPDLTKGRTVAQAIEYFSFKMAGSHEPYPLENFPPYRALQGHSAYVDDMEMHLQDKIIPMEVWAKPILDEGGNVEAAVTVFEDITLRKQAEAELAQYHKMLESLVEQRTAEVNAANKELRLRLEWLAAVNLVNQMIARSAEFSEVQEKIVEIIKHLFASQDAFIAELDLMTRQMNILTHSGSTENPQLQDLSVSLPERMPSHMELEPGKPIMISKNELVFLDGPMDMHIQETGVQSIAFIPLLMRDKVLGYLGLELQEEGRTITNDESNLLTIFSTDIAQLLEDARLFEQAKMLVAVEERNRLARELHDSVAQTLYSISLFIDATRLALKTNKPKVVESHLEELTLLSREAMSDMRLLIFELRPPILEKSGLAAALQSRLESVEAKAGFEASFQTGGALHLSPAAESELYRIAQEALNNVIKHAQAKRVAVRLIGESGCVRMTIEDDGVGFDPLTAEHGGGQGFRNMRERAANIGAHCSFESVPGQGTKITIEVNE